MKINSISSGSHFFVIPFIYTQEYFLFVLCLVYVFNWFQHKFNIDLDSDLVFKLDNWTHSLLAPPKKKVQLTALNLPADTDSKVLEYLDFFDIMNLSRVNRRLYYSTHRDESELVQTDQNVKSIMHICSPNHEKNDWDPLRRLKLTQGSKIFGSNYHHNLVVQDLHLYDYKELRQMGDESSIVIQTYDYLSLIHI